MTLPITVLAEGRYVRAESYRVMLRVRQLRRLGGQAQPSNTLHKMKRLRVKGTTR
jgi:hypothetical protein